MTFKQLQKLASELNCVLERDRRDGGQYSLYSNDFFMEYAGLKNLDEVATTLAVITEHRSTDESKWEAKVS